MTSTQLTGKVLAPAPHGLTRRRQSFLRRHWPVLVLAVLTVTASLLVRRSFFPFGFSGDADEGTYVLQAHLLLDGHLTLPTGSASGALRPWLTGESDHHVFTQYLPGWPAMLATSSALFGTMMWAPALAAAGWVIAVYALTLELLADRRTATIAAALLGCSPIVLVHGVVYLPYAFTAAILTAALACLLRGMRIGAKAPLVAAGVLSGIALLTRPFDLLLVAAPACVFVTAGQQGRMADTARKLGWVFAGGAPFVMLLLLFDVAVTGHPFLTPLSAADPLNRFGFGVRRIMPGEPTVGYSFSTAVLSLRANLHGMGSWLLGGPIVGGLAVIGLFFRSRRRQRVLLLAVAAAFPIGYLFWWGTALSAHGAVNGIGPHYYLPAFGPLAILAADTSARACRAVRARMMNATALTAIALTVVAGCVLTVTAIKGKIHTQQAVNAEYRQAQLLLPSKLTNALVVVSANPASSFVGKPFPFWNNAAGPNASPLFASDQGPRGYQLGLQFPERQLIRLSTELSTSAGNTDVLSVASGPVLWVHATFTSPAKGAALTAYLTANHHRRPLVLTKSSSAAAVFHCSWLLTGADLSAGPQYVSVGLAVEGGPRDLMGQRWEQRLSAGPSPDGVAIQSPGYSWRLTPTAGSLGAAQLAWQETSVATVMRVQIDQIPGETTAP